MIMNDEHEAYLKKKKSETIKVSLLNQQFITQEYQ
mgnify:CR=1 FL=1